MNSREKIGSFIVGYQNYQFTTNGRADQPHPTLNLLCPLLPSVQISFTLL